MRLIYTAMSPTEVRDEIVRVASSTSLRQLLLQQVTELGMDEPAVLKMHKTKLLGFLRFVQDNVQLIDSQLMVETRVGVRLRWLMRHRDRAINEQATALRATLRTNYNLRLAERATKVRRQG